MEVAYDKITKSVRYPSQHILDYKCLYFNDRIFIRQAELVLARSPGETSTNILKGWWTGGGFKIMIWYKILM